LKTLVNSDVALPQKQNAIFIEGHNAGTQLFSIDAVLLSSRIDSADQSNALNFNRVHDNSDKVCHSFLQYFCLAASILQTNAMP